MVKVSPEVPSMMEKDKDIGKDERRKMFFFWRVFHCVFNAKSCKISTVIMSCICLTLMIWILAITISLVLFFVYDGKEKDKNSEKIESVKSFAATSLQRELANIEVLAKSIKAFTYEASETITKEKFSRFVRESGIGSTSSFLDVLFIVDVPHERESYWRDEYINSLGLESEEMSILYYNTSFDPSFEHHYIVVLSEPYHDHFFGLDIGIYGPTVANCINFQEPQYYISSQYSGFDIYYPVIKTNYSMNNSKLVNSAIKARFLFDPLAEEAFEVYGDEALFAIYHNEECLIQTCKDPGSHESATDTFNPTGGKDKVDWSLDITMSITPLDKFYDYELRTSKVFGIVGPLICAIVLGLLLIPLCLQCVQYVKNSSEMKVIKQVSKSLAEMNFNSRQIARLENKFVPSKVEKYMKKIVKNMKLYRSYLPRTLLDKLEETKKSKKKKRKEDFETLLSNQNIEMGDILPPGSDDTTSNFSDEVHSDTDTSTSRTGISSQNSFHSSNSSNAVKRRKRRKFFLSSGSSIRALSKISNCVERNVVMMIVRMDNFEDDFSSFSVLRRMEEFQGHYEEWISTIISTVKRFGAEFLCFVGDKVYFSWNAVRIQMEGTRKSVLAAFELIKIPFFEKRNITITVTLTYGNALVGHYNIEKHEIKQFDILGYPLVTGKDILREVDQQQQQITSKDDDVSRIFCDDRIRQDIRYISESVCTNAIIREECMNDLENSSQVRPSVVKIYQLLSFLGKKTGEHDSTEWMYQCKDGFDEGRSGDVKEVFELVDEAWDCYLQGNEESAKEMIRLLKGRGQDERVATLSKKMEETTIPSRSNIVLISSQEQVRSDDEEMEIEKEADNMGKEEEKVIVQNVDEYVDTFLV